MRDSRPHVKAQTAVSRFNTTASSVRSGGEPSNATMKNWYGKARVRYLGLARNHCHLQFVACAMNMKRALVLLGAG
jgi:transposase, IS5 family